MQSYFAPGKVMLTGEYAVLKGLEAFAFPTKQGQWLDVFVYDTPKDTQPTLTYNAVNHQGETWLSASYDLLEFKWIESSDDVDFLSKIMEMVRNDFWQEGKSYRLETRLEFDRNAGLGSSSTFISLISRFFRLDPFLVQREVFGGSGYDVAIAEVGKSLRFSLVNDSVHFRQWEISEELTADWYIAFTGSKIDSRASSKEVSDKLDLLWEDEFYKSQLEHVSRLIAEANNTMVLETGLEMYQTLLSQLLELKRPYETLGLKAIPRGLCKWLGAWGGDMLLVNKIFLEQYEAELNEFNIQPWNEVIAKQ